MATNAKDIIPVRATHPGSILKRELQARNIKQKDFAKTIGMPAPNLSEIIKGKRSITDSIAIKLEEALGIPYQTWINLQSRYNYVVKRKAELDSAESLAQTEEQSLVTRLNLAALYKYFDIDGSTALNRISLLKKRLAIDLNELQTLEVNTVGYFKRSDRLKIDELNMRTWLLLAWSEASKSDLNIKYKKGNAQEGAIEIAKLANEGNVSIETIRDILNLKGIIFKHIPVLEAAPIDAYSTMIGKNPAIAVSFRNNNMEQLVFDTLHELGHIHQHLSSDKSFITVEHEYSSQSIEEVEADEFANNILIPNHTWKEILSVTPKSIFPESIAHTIAREATKRDINPKIALARYRQETERYNTRRRRFAI